MHQSDRKAKLWRYAMDLNPGVSSSQFRVTHALSHHMHVTNVMHATKITQARTSRKHVKHTRHACTSRYARYARMSRTPRIIARHARTQEKIAFAVYATSLRAKTHGGIT